MSLLPQGDWIYNKWESPTFPDVALSISRPLPSWKVQHMYHITQKEHCQMTYDLQVSNCSTEKEATRILANLVTTSCCRFTWNPSSYPWASQLSIKTLLLLLRWSSLSLGNNSCITCELLVLQESLIAWPLLVLFQLFYLAACSKEKGSVLPEVHISILWNMTCSWVLDLSFSNKKS